MPLLVCVTYRVGNRICERYFMNSPQGMAEALRVWSHLNRTDRIGMHFATVGDDKKVIIGEAVLDATFHLINYSGDEHEEYTLLVARETLELVETPRQDWTWKELWQHRTGITLNV